MMKKLILTLCLLLLFCGCTDAATKIDLDRLSWSQTLPIGENITFNGGFVTRMSTDMYISPMTFGAKGDGVTDDTMSLQTSIDYAFDRGYIVGLPYKTFRTTDELSIPSGTTIKGQRGRQCWQQGSIGNGSFIFYDGDGIALNITNPDGGYTYAVTLEDFVLCGRGTTMENNVGTGIYCRNLSEFSFSGLNIRHFTTGIYGDDLTIGHIDETELIWNDVGIDIDFGAQFWISHCNIWNNHNGVKFGTVTSSGILYSQFERCTNFIVADTRNGFDTVQYNILIKGNHFNNDPRIYTPDDGLAPYWNCRMINISNSNDTAHKLILSKWTIETNSIYMYETDHHISINFTTGDSYAYLNLYDNLFYGLNTSVVAEIGAGTGVLSFVGNSIPSGNYSSGNCQVSGFSTVWDRTEILGGLKLNTTPTLVEGSIWYDGVEKEMKFYNGTSVRTINSS